MTKNEQIASILLEAAELLKNDPELDSLNEGYSKDTYKKFENDFKSLKAKLVKGNKLRVDGKFDEAKTVLNEVIDDARDARKKVDQTPDPKGLARITSTLFGIPYVESKSKLNTRITKKTDTYGTSLISDGVALSKYSTIEKKDADTDSSRSFYIRKIYQIISAVLSDAKSLIALCDKEDDRRDLTNFELGIFNGKSLSNSK